MNALYPILIIVQVIVAILLIVTVFFHKSSSGVLTTSSISRKTTIVEPITKIARLLSIIFFINCIVIARFQYSNYKKSSISSLEGTVVVTPNDKMAPKMAPYTNGATSTQNIVDFSGNIVPQPQTEVPVL